jgi:hypothetical protein
LADRPDAEVLDRMRQMWQEEDPVPADLAERISFVLSLENIEVELLRLESQQLVGARGEERARTVTFTSENLTVMVTLGAASATGIRLDGWIAAGGGLRVELRARGGTRGTVADAEGRFVLDAVPPGLVQLAFLPTPDAVTALTRVVVTPALEL